MTSYLIRIYDYHKSWRHITDIECDEADTVEEAEAELKRWSEEDGNKQWLPVRARAYKMTLEETFTVDSQGICR